MLMPVARKFPGAPDLKITEGGDVSSSAPDRAARAECAAADGDSLPRPPKLEISEKASPLTVAPSPRRPAVCYTSFFTRARLRSENQ